MLCPMTVNDERYTLVAGARYQQRAKKCFRQHPNLRPAYERLFANLTADPFAPALRLHALSGQLTDKWAVSLTYAYRVTLTLLVTEREIMLLDIGSHDDVYR